MNGTSRKALRKALDIVVEAADDTRSHYGNQGDHDSMLIADAFDHFQARLSELIKEGEG